MQKEISQNKEEVERLQGIIEAKVNVGSVKTYVINKERWGIYDDLSHPEETTKGINDAINWAVKEGGFNHVFLPRGDYLIDPIGKKRFEEEGGIHIEVSNFHFELAKDARLKAMTNDAWGYNLIFTRKTKNIIISGGIIEGDRYEHDYEGYPEIKDRVRHEWGFGISIQGSENIIVENVELRNFTGDGIIVAAHGMIGVPWVDYTPPKRVTIKDCKFDSARRNNISVVSSDGVLIMNNKIINAGGPGTKDNPKSAGTTPQFGIDLEGYGEDDIDYETPDHVLVIGNYFKNNAVASLINFSGYKVIVSNNISDNLISYGNGTDTIITNNLMIREDRKGTAIAGAKVSQGFDRNGAIISGNMITGFETGIDVRGVNSIVSNNMINDVINGINCYNLENALIANNYVWKVQSRGINVTESVQDITIESNVLKDVKDTSMYLFNSKKIKIRSNDFSNCKKALRINGAKSIFAANNTFDVNGFEGAEGEIIIENNADVLLKDNIFNESKNNAVMVLGKADTRVKMIGNHFEKPSSFILVLCNDLKNLEMMNNTMSFLPNRNGVQGIRLERCSEALLLNNTISSGNEYTLGDAIHTANSSSTKILRNTILKGKINKNSTTDTDEGNIVIG
ncbi:structural protein [Bacillus phage vB_BauM_KLEB27-3]|nr:structural protein [Bacillus phage vB_BauM_KLEB27-3]